MQKDSMEFLILSATAIASLSYILKTLLEDFFIIPRRELRELKAEIVTSLVFYANVGPHDTEQLKEASDLYRNLSSKTYALAENRYFKLNRSAEKIAAAAKCLMGISNGLDRHDFIREQKSIIKKSLSLKYLN